MTLGIGSRILLAILCLLNLSTSASADHERFIVGEMRDVNPSPNPPIPLPPFLEPVSPAMIARGLIAISLAFFYRNARLRIK
jgi:hypothetical protein